MKINNILVVSVVYMSIIITVTGIYFYPLSNITIYYFAIGSIITSMLNHFTPTDHKCKKIFRDVDRITIRLSALMYIFMAKNIDKENMIIIEKYGKNVQSINLIYYSIFIGSLFYISSRVLKTKKPHFPQNLVKIPHALSHIIAGLITALLFCEYSDSDDAYDSDKAYASDDASLSPESPVSLVP